MALCSPQVIRENTRRDKLQKYYCDLCHAHCTTAQMMAVHLLGKKHKRYLQANRPQEWKAGIRLSHFLKDYMEKEPIVGMEYIQEVKKDSLYRYSCQLCGLLICHLPTIVGHLMDPSHIECYIKKHFLYLFPQFSKAPTKRDYVTGLRDAAVRILELQGNKKEIQDVLPESDRKISGASEDTPPSKPESDGTTNGASEDTPPSKPESDGKTPGASEDTPPSKPESDGKTPGASEDTPPSKPESDGKIWEASEYTPPSKPESDGKIWEASEYTPPSKPESDGKTSGASKDIPPSKPESEGTTSGASKDTPPSKPEGGNLSCSKLSPLPYQVTGLDESRESYRYNKMLQKSISNDPPLAKRSRRSPGSDQDALPSTEQISKHGSSHCNNSHAIRMDCTATQKLDFRTNDEFLEYLANFVISDDEDVLFIRTITQNCLKALTSFQEEDAERQKTGHQPEAPLEDTSMTAQEIPGILEDETESHLSDSETSLLKDNSNPLSDSIPKNEATNLFFNGIKNMDESEVVGVFQKIAAMNPEYKEMDIPTVIRFLKYSGRLKKP